MKKKSASKVIISICVTLVLIAIGVIVFLTREPYTVNFQDGPAPDPLTGEAETSNANYDYTKEPTLAWSKKGVETEPNITMGYTLLDYTDIDRVESGLVAYRGYESVEGTFMILAANPRTGDVVWKKDIGISGDVNCTPVSNGLRIVCIKPNPGQDSVDRGDADIEIIDGKSGEALTKEDSLCALIECVEPININNIQVVSASDKIIIFGSLGRNSEALFFYANNAQDLSESYKTVASHLSSGSKGGSASAVLLHSSHYLVGSAGDAYHVLDASSGALLQTYEPSDTESRQFAECHPGPFDDSYTCSELNVDEEMVVTDGSQKVYRGAEPIHTAKLEDFAFSTSKPIKGAHEVGASIGVVHNGETIDHDGNTTFAAKPTPVDGDEGKLPYPSPYSNSQYQTFGSTALELFGAQAPGAPLAAYSLPETSGEAPKLLWDLTPQLNPPDFGSNWFENTSAYLAGETLIAGLKSPGSQNGAIGLVETTPNTPTAFNPFTGERLWELPRTIQNSRSGVVQKRGYVIVSGTIITQDSNSEISGYTFNELG